jgi:TolB-like protein/class 3 adenylate cyclase/Tfp pilus assembly protein PilF
MERKLTTIVAMDVVGYSRSMELDEEGTLERLQAARATIINPAITRHSGRVVKLIGDGALVEFSSVVAALQCAVDIQRQLSLPSADASPQQCIALRIGLHLGDVIVEGDDLYGDAVNVASRLESIAPAGGIVLSKQVHDHIGSNVSVQFASLGQQQVKGIGRPIEAFVVELRNGLEAHSDSPDRLLDTAMQRSTTPTSVAVLPFTNLNADSESYMADGLTEDIATALSKNRWLAVVARNPAFAFRASNEPIRSIGQKLGASYLVTGSLRKVEARIRTTVQLLDASTEQSVWSERFDRDIVDIFELQEEISQLVAARIETELGLNEQKRAERRPRINLGAWDLYQMAAAEFYRFTPEANERCQSLLRRAIELDPELPGAYSRLAYAIILNMVYFDAPADTSRLDEALSAAQRAIQLDDQDANAYFTIGRVRLARREYALAIEALEHAVALNPSLAVSYCGLGDSLAYEGRLDEAVARFDQAIRLSPHDPFRWAFYSYRSLAHLFRGEFAEAASWARKSVQVPNSHYSARAHLVAALGQLGDQNQARSALDDLLRVKPEFTLAFARERLFYLKRPDQIETYIDGLKKAGVT